MTRSISSPTRSIPIQLSPIVALCIRVLTRTIERPGSARRSRQNRPGHRGPFDLAHAAIPDIHSMAT
jgi:hypothetical protein